MTQRMVLPLLFGLIGAAILVWLGTWQVQRLAWKQDVLAEISARITAAPVAVPPMPDPEADRFLPVQAEGALVGQELLVLASLKQVGAIYRVVSVFETGGRRLLLDRGYVRASQKPEQAAVGALKVVGNLHWPREVDSYTPKPDTKTGLWFARDVDAMAKALGTEPVLIVMRSGAGTLGGVTPYPVSIEGIPNDHLQYAITWYLLAIAWLGMTGYLLWRIRQETD
jgi:surfeit locus 1 family protein